MDIESLIDKVLRNKATKEEIEIVEKWKSETEANVQALKQMQKMLLNTASLNSYEEFDKVAAWAKMEDVLKEDSQIEYEEVRQIRPLYRRWLNIAAAVALLIAGAIFVILGDHTSTSWTAEKEMVKLDLEDGSHVWLNHGTKLNAKNDFSSERSLSLEGEAFFDVVSNPSTPFIVETGGAEILVLGTQFNIKSRPGSLQVYVFEGSVQLSYQSQTLTLIAGQMANLINKKFEISYAGNEGLESWRKGDLVYKDYPLSEMLIEVSQLFGVTINQNGHISSNCRINTTISNENVQDILQELKLIYQLEYKIINQNVDILSINCE